MFTVGDKTEFGRSCEACGLAAAIDPNAKTVRQRDGLAAGEIVTRPLRNYQDVIDTWDCLCGHENDLD